MPETTEQLQDTEPLENRIDALLKDIDATTAAVRAELGDEPAPAEPPAAAPISQAPAAAAPTPSPADSILGDVASELDPGVPAPEPIAAAALEPAPAAAAPPAAAPSVDAPAEAPAAASVDDLMSAVGTEVATSPSSPEPADATDQVDVDFVSPDAIAPPEEEITQLSSADAAAMHADLDPASAKPVSPQPAAASAPTPTIQELDDLLASESGDAVERAIITAADNVEEPAPSAAPAAQTETHVSQPASTASPVAASAPKPAAPADPPVAPRSAEAAAAVPAPAPAPLLAALLSPVASLNARVPESTRQTVGYLAVMTVFFAIVMWGVVLLRTPVKPPATTPVPLLKHGEHAPEHFNPDSTAERVARAEAERKAAAPAEGHEKSGSDHGGKSDKADSGHGKPAEKKKADSHGAPPPDKKKADAKAAHH